MYSIICAVNIFVVHSPLLQIKTTKYRVHCADLASISERNPTLKTTFVQQYMLNHEYWR